MQEKPGVWWGSRWVLAVVVFLTGAAVLVVEVVAFRMLSPYFGNTLYSSSSVLAVVLGALAVGYMLGGRLSDKRPSVELFYSLIVLSGVAVAFLRILAASFLPSFGYGLSVTTGPLFSSLILFFVPAVILGMLTPFAVKLAHTLAPTRGIGSVAGELSFASTVGSIVGSLLGGYALLPYFSHYAILLGTALALALIGLVPLGYMSITKLGRPGLALLFILIVPFVSPVSANVPPDETLLYATGGTYTDISITEGEFAGHPTRFLHMDRSSSSAMWIDSEELAFPYTRYYELYHLSVAAPERVLVLGGGAYSIPKAFLKDEPQAEVVVSEIEPKLLELSHEYFDLPRDNPKLVNVVGDGRRLLQEDEGGFDVIYGDVYQSLYSIPSHVATKEFFELTKSRLNENGIFIMNVIGSLARDVPSQTLAMMRTFETAFPNSYFIATEDSRSSAPQNIVFLGFANDDFVPQAGENPGVGEEVWAHWQGEQVDTEQFNLRVQPLLTDTYTPLERLNAKLLERVYEAPSVGEEALSLIKEQVGFGPRIMESPGSERWRSWLVANLKASNLIAAELPFTTPSGTSGVTMLARVHPEATKRMLLATHYDTKAKADQGWLKRDLPVPGANDGASGSALLLQIARSAQGWPADMGIDFVWFDGEEGSEGAAWQPEGSTYFVANNLKELYQNSELREVIVVDMVCDKQFSIAPEEKAMAQAPELTERVFRSANSLYPKHFSLVAERTIYDDHTPFLEAGIPATLLIDFDYPAWHTTRDVPSRCSASSLEKVYRVLETYLKTSALS